MTDTIKVFATDERHVGIIKHPLGPPLATDGVLWPYDGFTCGLLVDGTITRADDEKRSDNDDEQPEPSTIAPSAPRLAPVPSVL